MGEGSTGYFHSANVPERVYEALPEALLLLVLREPVARAISHYYHHVKRGRESRSLEDAFSAQVLQQFQAGELSDGLSYRYLNNGNYTVHLKHWLNYFPKDQFMILQAEQLFDQPQIEFDKVCEFLNLKRGVTLNFGVQNRGIRNDQENTVVKSRLIEFCTDRVNELQKLQMLEFNWKLDDR